MPQLDAVKIVESFWADVWVARNPDAIDRYVVEDFVITSGGVDIRTRGRIQGVGTPVPVEDPRS